MSVGKTIELLIRQRGLNNSEVGRGIGRASQLVGYDIAKQDLNTSIIRLYTDFFDISLADFFALAEGPVAMHVVDEFIQDLEDTSARMDEVKKLLLKETARIQAMQTQFRTAMLKAEPDSEEILT